MAEEWLHKRPIAPRLPYAGLRGMRSRKCAEWGIEFPDDMGLRWPCHACKAGTAPQASLCRLCNGTGRLGTHAWRAYFATEVCEFEERRRQWKVASALHRSIKKKLTPEEREYIGIE